MGRFQISQAYKGAAHDGLDLVGIDSKEIHATANGKVVFAGWENPGNHCQGFGQYVVILADGCYYHYGHLSEIRVSVGQQVRCTDVIGIEGSTGSSTGSHCHYCVRTSMSPGTALDVCAISGIPNNEWGIYDDGYRSQAQATTPAPDIRALQLALNTEGCMLDVDGICGPKTPQRRVSSIFTMARPARLSAGCRTISTASDTPAAPLTVSQEGIRCPA